MHLVYFEFELKDFECENSWWQYCDNGSHLGSIQEVSSQQSVVPPGGRSSFSW